MFYTHEYCTAAVSNTNKQTGNQEYLSFCPPFMLAFPSDFVHSGVFRNEQHQKCFIEYTDV